MARGTRASDDDLERPLGDVLGEIADALEIAGDADGARRFAQIDRHRLAARDGEDGALLDFALQRVEARVAVDDLWARSTSKVASASIASASIFSAMPPISAIRRPSTSRSRS